MVRAAGNAPACSCSRSRRLTFRLRSEELPSALNSVASHYSDRARSLSADRVQLGEMVEHHGIAPCIPAWKAGVYLSTPMLESDIGVPCGICTHLDGFADRCLCCSANGTERGIAP